MLICNCQLYNSLSPTYRLREREGRYTTKFKEFLRQRVLRWLPMVLFSYNRIYRDQTLSARITRGMFVASYNKIFHIQSIGRPTKLARSGTPRTHATAYLLYNYPKVGNFIRDYQSNKNTYIQNFDRN